MPPISFTLTDLGNKSGEVAEAAIRGPVNITKRGKRRFVLISAEEYDRLVGAKRMQRAVHVDDLNEAEAARYIAALSEADASGD